MNGDAMSFQSAIVDGAGSISGALRGGGRAVPMPRRSGEGGRQVRRRRLHGARARRTDPATLARRVFDAGAKFRAAFDQAEALGDCIKAGQADAIESLVDDFVARTVAKLFPV